MATRYLNDHQTALRERDVGDGVPTASDVWKKTMPVGRYEVDTARSHAEFVTRAFRIYPVEGRFDEVRGHVQLREAVEESGLDIRIATGSVDTGLSLRDAHLRSSQYLGADQHPEIRFVGEHLQPLGNDTYAAHGLLTVRGTTEPGVFHVTVTDTFFEGDATYAQMVATAEVDRRAFGVPTSELIALGGLMVDPTVRVRVHITACIDER